MSNYEDFFTGTAYAVVGHSAKMTFPKLTYRGLKQSAQTVYAVDPSTDQMEGDPAYNSFEDLPKKVDRVILEVPKAEAEEWITRAADYGVKDVWLHMGCESAAAKAVAQERGINLRTGTCAVMYVTPGFTFHSIHKWVMKLAGKY